MSHPYIETIKLDPKIEKKVLVKGLWHVDQNNQIKFGFFHRVYCVGNNNNSPDRVVTYRRNNTFVGTRLVVECFFYLDRIRDIHKLEKDKEIDRKVKEGFQAWIDMGTPEVYRIKL